MALNSKFKIRIVDSIYHRVIYEDNLSWQQAVERFEFYVKCALELDVHIMCVNILKGKQKKSLKTFINHD